MLKKSPPTKQTLEEIFNLLLKQHGPQGWWPVMHGYHDFEVVCGSLLTQNTTWENAKKSLSNMYQVGIWDFRALFEADQTTLIKAIHPSGFHSAKAKKLREFAKLVVTGYGGDIKPLLKEKNLREILLGLWGVGEETADAIALYGAKVATFTSDKYTQRIFTRLGYGNFFKNYEASRNVFMNTLDKDVPLFSEYHALIVKHGGKVCTKTNPKCSKCHLFGLCSYK